jgi:hypothetical protein
MKSGKWLACLVGLFSLLLSPAAFALRCMDASSGGTSIVQQIPTNIAVPADAVTGAVIWESPQYNITMTCTQDWGSGKTDVVSLYVNPANVPPATGTTIGIRWNGTVYQKSSGTVSLGQTLGNSNPTATFPFSFSVVLLKSGDTPATGVATFSNYRVFQVDGSGGLNITPNVNLNFLLNGNVRFIGCNATLTFSPSSTVDFGAVSAVGAVGEIAAARPLTLTATRACTSPYALGVYFSPTVPSTLADPSTWDLGNGVGVNLLDGVTGSLVPLDGSVSDFVDLSTLSTGSRSYTVQLKRLRANGTVGAYSGTMTVLLQYQ